MEKRARHTANGNGTAKGAAVAPAAPITASWRRSPPPPAASGGPEGSEPMGTAPPSPAARAAGPAPLCSAAIELVRASHVEGETVAVPRPSLALRYWDAAVGEYAEMEAFLKGAPRTPDELENW